MRHRRVGVSSTYIALLLAVASTPRLPTAVGEPPGPSSTLPAADDVRFVIAQSNKSFEAAKNVTYRFHQVVASQEEPKKITLDGIAKQSGEYEAVRTKDAYEYHSDRPSQITAAETVSFIGPISCGLWITGNTFADEYSYSRPAAMSDRAENAMTGSRPPHPEKYAFGNGRALLQEMLQAAIDVPGSDMWRVKHVNGTDGRKLIRLEMYQRAQSWPELPSNIFDIDPARGFAVIHSEERLPHAPYPLIRRIDVEVAEVAGPGTWYPIRVTERYYEPEKSPDPLTTSELSLSGINPRASFAEKDFSIEWLALPEGQKVIRVAEDGTETIARRYRGTLIIVDAPERRTAGPALQQSRSQAVNALHKPNAYTLLALSAFTVGLLLLLAAKIAQIRRRSK